MNDFNKTLKDIIKQYRKIGFQTHYWRSKETGEVFVYMRKGEVVASMIIFVGCVIHRNKKNGYKVQ